MSFFVSKDIEARLDEKTLNSQAKSPQSAEEDYCQLCIDNNETLCYYKIKKFYFLDKNKIELVIESSAKVLAGILSAEYRILKISLPENEIRIVKSAVKSGEINRNGSYDLVISCLTE